MPQFCLSYTGLNLSAAWLVGKEIWFRYGEFFSVFFRLIGMTLPWVAIFWRGIHPIIFAGVVRMISDPFNLGWNLFGTGK